MTSENTTAVSSFHKRIMTTSLDEVGREFKRLYDCAASHILLCTQED